MTFHSSLVLLLSMGIGKQRIIQSGPMVPQVDTRLPIQQITAEKLIVSDAVGLSPSYNA